ncbi:MAG: MerR family transcriptional regulator [Sphingomonadales bacterium]|nr:MerR family transcriptional regulator [Sphingomonadales bacterium]
MSKDDGAFLTIGELAQQLGVAQHILRYWETRFPQLRPLQRSGNRRYYRPRDVEVAQRINRLLNEQGFTVRGAQRVLAGKQEAAETEPEEAIEAAQPVPAASPASVAQAELALGDAAGSARPAAGPEMLGTADLGILIARLTVIRNNLREAIEAE